jgi:hypothetical protein
MARFAIDTITNLYRTYEIEAASMEEAITKLESRFDEDDFIIEHFIALKDPSITDWTAENIELEPYKKLDDNESYPKA